MQEWVYRNGYLSEHTRINRSDPDASADITLIGRDEDGRITGMTCARAATGPDFPRGVVAAATS